MIEITGKRKATPNLEHPKLADMPEVVKELKRYLPTVYPTEITMMISDIDRSIANGLRRYVIGGFRKKALGLSAESIDIKSPPALIDDIINRICFIPLDQSCPEDVTFSLEYINNSQDDEFVTSESLVASDGGKYIQSVVSILMLRPGEYIYIDDIYVETGINRMNAKFSVSSCYRWNCVDYVRVLVLHRKNIQGIMIHVSEYNEIIEKHGSDPKKQMLLVPEKSNEDFHNMEFLNIGYHVINIGRKIEHIQSTMAEQRHHEFSFITLMDDPEVVIESFFTDTVEVLQEIDECLDECEKQDTSMYGIIVMKKSREETVITVIGHTHTIGEILRSYIYMRDPNIPFMDVFQKHPRDESMVVRIIHNNPIKVIRDAIYDAIMDLQKYGSNIKGLKK